MTPEQLQERYLENEATGRMLRSTIVDMDLLGTAVEIRPANQPDWTSMEHANDVLYRALLVANRAGLDGKKLTRISITGCTQYGNLTLGWNYEDLAAEVAP